MIDHENNQVGIIRTVEALTMAREAELDLVEVSATSKPPVCRLMDYGKWKYDQKKKEHKARVKQHNVILKEVRLRPKIDQHDRDTKVNNARKFLEKGNKVQFTMMFKGREMMHLGIANEMFALIVEELSDCSKVDSPPKRAGRRMNLVLGPHFKVEKPIKPKKEYPTEQEQAQSADPIQAE